MTIPFSPQTILDPQLRLDYTKHLLRLTDTTDGLAHPIALFCFLHDTLAFLAQTDRTKRTHSSLTRPSTSRNNSRDKVQHLAERTNRGESDRATERTGDKLLEAGARTEPPLPWNAWVGYLTELYLHPDSPQSTDSAAADAPWTSPLRLSSSIVTYLQHLPQSPIFDDSTRTLLLAACRSAVCLLSNPGLTPSSSPTVTSRAQATVDMLMTEAASSTFPHSLPCSSYSQIAHILAAQRQAGSTSSAPTSTSREILTTLLEHHVSPTFHTRVDDDGQIWFGDKQEEDRLVRSVFKTDEEEPTWEGDGSVEVLASEEEDDADTRSIATGIREAHESIARKENKLRQLLGENWQQGPHATPASSPAPSSKRAWSTRPVSYSPETSMPGSSHTVRPPRPSQSAIRRGDSFESDLSAVSPVSSPPSVPPEGDRVRSHHRFVSTSSSQTPLIDEPSSPSSPAASPPRSFLHRRGMSSQGGLIYAPSSLTLPSAKPGLPPVSPAIPTPLLQRDLDSPSTVGKPFQDLAPAVPISPPHGAGLRAGPSSPRRTSLDSSLDFVYGHPRAAGGGIPLNKNALTANEKRQLVRRSKKLEGFFGATFQEEAAHRVLSGGRGGQPESVSPTNTAFPLPASVPAAGASSGRPAAASLSSAITGHARQASLAPPCPQSHAIPWPSYQSGTRTRQATDLSHLSRSSSTSSLAPPSPTYSHPPPTHSRSSTSGLQPTFARMYRSSSSPSRRSSSFSSLASPDHAYFSHHPRRMSTFEREDQAREREREREERRRKLDKVRRMLGERVPVSLVCGEDENEGLGVGSASVSAPMTKAKSTGGAVSGLLKGVKLGGGTGGSGAAGGGGGVAGQEKQLAVPPRAGGDAGWTYVEPHEDARSRVATPNRPMPAGRVGRQGVEALNKARKLESLFGDLPPQSLYLGTTSPTLNSNATTFTRPGLSTSGGGGGGTHRRSVSDLSSSLLAQPERDRRPTSSSSSTTSSAATGPGPSSVPLALRRFTTGSTADSYRQSIASLGYIAEQDPAALDDIARVYTRSSGSGSASSVSQVGEGEGGVAAETAKTMEKDVQGVEQEQEFELDEDDQLEESEDGTSGTDGGAIMARSLSVNSHRAVRQAQKLSAFFGTTRGEVWHMLLDDIQASIEDDPSLDEDEREEVLSGVERLRRRGRL
ncbi:hypothetical protein JCM11641_003469 [Rhodosporidiobolus odoratus]